MVVMAFENDDMGNVAKTANMLDEVKPGWRASITKPVNMGDRKCCIIGQLYGDFWDAPVADLAKLGYVYYPSEGYEMFQRVEWAIKNGLAVRGSAATTDRDDQFVKNSLALLTREWRVLLKDRPLAEAA